MREQKAVITSSVTCDFQLDRAIALMTFRVLKASKLLNLQKLTNC